MKKYNLYIDNSIEFIYNVIKQRKKNRIVTPLEALPKLTISYFCVIPKGVFYL